MAEAFTVEQGLYGGPTEPPDRYSMSLLQAAERCLLQAHFKRVSDPSGEFAIVGNAVHDAIAAMGLMAGARGVEVVEPDEAARVAASVLDHPERIAPITAEGRTQVVDMVARFARSHSFPIDADEFVVELNSRVELGGVVTSARIDQAAKRGPVAEVDDWKSGPGLPSEAAVAEHVQLPIYALHLAVRWPDVEVFHLREHYLRYGVVRGPIVLERAALGAVEDWIATVAARLAAAYAAGDIPPTPGSWCANCPGKAACPLPTYQRPAAIESTEDALAVLSQLIVNGERVEDDKAALKAWLEAEGLDELVQGDTRAGFTPGTRKSFDKKRALADLGATEADYTTESPKVDFKVAKVRPDAG